MSYPKFDTPKDPEDISDFSLSFSDVMPADDLVASVTNVTIAPFKTGPASTLPDVSMATNLYSGQTVIVWLTGGQPGWTYVLGVEVMTTGGRTFRRRMLLDVQLQ